MTDREKDNSGSRKKRLFIALNPPEEVKKEVAGLINSLARLNGGLKWARGEGLHLTLHFLGYLDETEEELIKQIMKGSAGKFGPIEFGLGEIDAFPNLNNARIVFLKCKQQNGQSAEELQKQLKRGLIQAGFNVDERLWQAHITLGRDKQRSRLKIPDYKLQVASFKIDSFELMESELTADGADYKTVASFQL